MGNFKEGSSRLHYFPLGILFDHPLSNRIYPINLDESCGAYGVYINEQTGRTVMAAKLDRQGLTEACVVGDIGEALPARLLGRDKIEQKTSRQLHLFF